jgi:mono/diheme cytochrome c family protein
MRSVKMNHKRLLTLCVVILVGLATSWAADGGASLYKTKCAGCHGASGEGKPAMKAPALKGTSLESAQIVDHLTKGESTSKPPHNKGISGLSADQAKAIADFVKTLK